MSQQETIERTIIQLRDDFKNLQILASDFLEKVKKVPHAHQKDLQDIILKKMENDKKEAFESLEKLRTISTTEQILALIRKRREIETDIHYCAGIIGGFSVSENWQSPSFIGSMFDQAGIHIGKIRQSQNDYSRDQHHEGNLYAQSFLKAYVDHSPLLLVKAFAVNSGMAALTTIIHFLRGEHGIDGPILLGQGSYFENKKLIHKEFSSVLEFDENDLHSLPSLISRVQPKAVFFDTIGNNPEVTLPNSEEILKIVRKESKESVFIVADNTGQSIYFQPFHKQHILDSKLNLICFESLNKYHQFGLDRVTGGIIYSAAKKDIYLYDYRDHLGTNIGDAQVQSLPTPNRLLLKNRLERHQQNANSLAKALSTAVNNSPNSPLSEVVYPSLQSHSVLSEQKYTGSLVTLLFKKNYRSVNFYNRMLKVCISRAKASGIPIIGGTSFGLSTTRMYIPASRPGQGIPFFRIALGTETDMELTNLITVLQEVFAR